MVKIGVLLPKLSEKHKSGAPLILDHPVYSSFSMDPQHFPLGANLYQKLPILAILGAVSPYFKSHNDEVWHEVLDLRLPLTCQI